MYFISLFFSAKPEHFDVILYSKEKSLHLISSHSHLYRHNLIVIWWSYGNLTAYDSITYKKVEIPFASVQVVHYGT